MVLASSPERKHPYSLLSPQETGNGGQGQIHPQPAHRQGGCPAAELQPQAPQGTPWWHHSKVRTAPLGRDLQQRKPPMLMTPGTGSLSRRTENISQASDPEQPGQPAALCLGSGAHREQACGPRTLTPVQFCPVGSAWCPLENPIPDEGEDLIQSAKEREGTGRKPSRLGRAS